MPFKCFLIEETGERWTDGNVSGSYWRRVDTREVAKHIADFPVGAMWRAVWFKSDSRRSPDGRPLYGWEWDNQFEPPLIVKTPGGDWNIDGRASNCTMKEDALHRCWIRHGDPPEIHVDKNGLTCGAGAGSIMCGDYHGFLYHGSLT